MRKCPPAESTAQGRMGDKLLKEELQRLLKAYSTLRDPRVRAIILELVEETAADSRTVTESLAHRLPRRMN